jgi:hypothetical protein
MSATRDPVGHSWRNSATWGHGFLRVAAKDSAMRAYVARISGFLGGSTREEQSHVPG